MFKPHLLASCKNLESANPSQPNGTNNVTSQPVNPLKVGGMNGEKKYTEEHVQVIRNIKRSTDYYEILGVGKSCSVEEVKKAYRKLSLKVHPDKNKAPGSEEAFKKVSKAFKCLSDDNSRRHYDHTGFVEGGEYSQQYNGMRRRRTGHNGFDENVDADEIFRSFFGQGDMFRTAHVYRTRRAAAGGQPTGGGGDGSWISPNLLLVLQLLPILLIISLAFLPFSEPEYSLQKNYIYQFSKTTKEYGVEFYVKSSNFDQKYPLGTPARGNIENSVIRDHKNLLRRYCHVEMQGVHGAETCQLLTVTNLKVWELLEARCSRTATDKLHPLRVPRRKLGQRELNPFAYRDGSGDVFSRTARNPIGLISLSLNQLFRSNLDLNV